MRIIKQRPEVEEEEEDEQAKPFRSHRKSSPLKREQKDLDMDDNEFSHEEKSIEYSEEEKKEEEEEEG